MMQINKSPFFRKANVPWYATDTACMIKAAVMLVFILFGIDGIKVARHHEAYADYVWIPMLFSVLSAAVLAVNLVRLIRRYTESSAS